MKLSEVKVGHYYKEFEITGFSGSELMQARLREMGLRAGLLISVIGQAPFGGPLLVQYNSNFLALRLAESSCINIKVD